jgi:hypothetical protein
MKPGDGREREKFGSIGDFAFNDSDPEKMTATTSICMITITVSVQMMILFWKKT